MDDEIIILPIEICRICTNLISNLNILTEKLEDEQVLLHEALEFVSCIRIDFDDGMSQTMCLTCSKKLSAAYKFKNQILDSYRAFYNQTSDFNQSIHESDSDLTTVIEANSIEPENKLGIKLSTDAVSFLLEHNSKTRNKDKPLSREQNVIAEENVASIDQMKIESIAPPPIKSNEVDNNETTPIEVETPTIEEALTEENDNTVELIQTKENDDFIEVIQTQENDDSIELIGTKENEHSIEFVQTTEHKYTIELMETEENEPPPIKSNQADNIETPSIEENQTNHIEPPLIEKDSNKTSQTPNAWSQEKKLTSSDRRTTKLSAIKPNMENNKTKSNKVSCHICHKVLPKKSNLEDHLRLHANEKNFVCSICQKAFVQIANYRTHLRVHTKERPYHCHLCSKTYSQSGSLRTHIRSHTNERIYVCKICYKSFTNSSDLGKHERIHDLSLQFKCETCGHFFTQKANLRVHERKMHFK